MKYLQASSSLKSGGIDFKVDDDVYEKYKNAKFRYAVSGEAGNSYITLLQEKKDKYLNFARILLNVTEKNLYVTYVDGDPKNLTRENLKLKTRGEINRQRLPRDYGRKFKGTSYVDGKWYSVVYLPEQKKFIRPCLSEAEAARVYDETLDYLNIEGYRNFPEKVKNALSAEDKKILDSKLRKKIRRSGTYNVNTNSSLRA